MMTGAQAMVKCLESQGISVVFGYPGATIAPFYDALTQSEIPLIYTGENRLPDMRPVVMPGLPESRQSVW